jgi:hypothetical protein
VHHLHTQQQKTQNRLQRLKQKTSRLDRETSSSFLRLNKRLTNSEHKNRQTKHEVSNLSIRTDRNFSLNRADRDRLRDRLKDYVDQNREQISRKLERHDTYHYQTVRDLGRMESSVGTIKGTVAALKKKRLPNQ